MFHMQERQLSLSSLFKKPVHNAVRHFSCCLEATLFGSPFKWSSIQNHLIIDCLINRGFSLLLLFFPENNRV